MDSPPQIGRPADDDPSPPPRRRRPATCRCAASDGLFTPYRGPLAVVTAIIVASSLVGMASPFLLRAVIDDALPQQNLALLVWLVGRHGRRRRAHRPRSASCRPGSAPASASTSCTRLRTSVFAHLQRQSLAFFTRTRTGEVQSRITNDIGGMQSVVTSTATSIASNLTTVVATAVAMAALSWQLSLISLVVMPPAIYLTRRVARMRREITAQRQSELADLNVTIDEGLSISGVQLAKTMGAGPALVDGSPPPPRGSSTSSCAPSSPGAGGWPR